MSQGFIQTHYSFGGKVAGIGEYVLQAKLRSRAPVLGNSGPLFLWAAITSFRRRNAKLTESHTNSIPNWNPTLPPFVTLS